MDVAETYFGGKGAEGTYLTIINQIAPCDVFYSCFLGYCKVTQHLDRPARVVGFDQDDKVAIQLLEECAYFVALYIKEYGRGNSGSEALFPGLTTRQIRYHMRKYLVKAGLKTDRISAHSLRHTTGQVLLKQGVDPIYVQRHLRHKSFATTQIYVQQQIEEGVFSEFRHFGEYE